MVSDGCKPRRWKHLHEAVLVLGVKAVHRLQGLPAAAGARVHKGCAVKVAAAVGAGHEALAQAGGAQLLVAPLALPAHDTRAAAQ